jgi:hypothetical protein
MAWCFRSLKKWLTELANRHRNRLAEGKLDSCEPKLAPARSSSGVGTRTARRCGATKGGHSAFTCEQSVVSPQTKRYVPLFRPAMFTVNGRDDHRPRRARNRHRNVRWFRKARNARAPGARRRPRGRPCRCGRRWPAGCRPALTQPSHPHRNSACFPGPLSFFSHYVTAIGVNSRS